MANHYEVPNWAGKPPVGLHLDVLKGDKLIQKLMVDEKKCYLFGRNQQLNDFCIDHASCSRVHSALVYHKHLNRAFLVDLGSTHGTYIGNMRLESQKPTQLPIDSTFHFGASTRYYIIRERPQSGARAIIEEMEKSSDDIDSGGLLGLPETETELDVSLLRNSTLCYKGGKCVTPSVVCSPSEARAVITRGETHFLPCGIRFFIPVHAKKDHIFMPKRRNLTEFNTAHNRRISMLGISDDDAHKPTRKRKKKGITFNDDEEVINPEDVDPSVGRFRNLVQTTVVPSKRMRLEGGLISLSEESHISLKHIQPSSATTQLYHDLPPEQFTPSSMPSNPFSTALTSLTSRLGIALPNPAPEVEMTPNQMQTETPHIPEIQGPTESHALEPKKKKYAKEAWPGKKPLPTLLV